MSYIEIIKAKRAEMDAHKLAEKLEKERQHAACVEAFKDFRTVWNEVRTTIVPHYRNERNKEMLEEHCEKARYPDTYDNCTSLHFWASTGNSGEYFKCAWDEDVCDVAFRAGYNHGPDRTITKAAMMEEFLNFLAKRIPQ